MIIDAHCHVWTWDVISSVYWDELAEIGMDYFRKNHLGNPSREDIKSLVLASMMDSDGSKLLADMDASGVDMSFILALDWGYGIGEADQSIDQINRFYGSLARKHPDRIMAFAGVDPRRKDAVTILERAVNDYGCKGLKYHPTSGFYPDSEESYRVLEKAEALGIPLISHTGPSSKPLKSKYAQPVYLDAVLSDFPKLTVVAAHMGFCWWPELLNLMSAKATTFYADISGQQVKAKRHFPEFCRMLREAMDEAGTSKLMWGTDNPVLDAVIPMKDWVKMIKGLADHAPDGLAFSAEEIDALLGGNAARLAGKV